LAYITTLFASVIAVIGTVTASIYSQRSALRAKQIDFDLTQTQRSEEQKYRERKEWLEQRRACYVALNISIRQYRAAINDLLHGIRDRSVSEQVRLDLADARRIYIERHAEVQMIAPREVLKTAGAVRGHLSAWYGMVRTLDQSASAENDNLHDVFTFSEMFWDHIESMRTVMRTDLGISDSYDEPSESDRSHHPGAAHRPSDS
jgi:hypothetical protein